jgi:hypothetical protein
MDIGYNAFDGVIIAEFEESVFGFVAVLKSGNDKARIKVFNKILGQFVQDFLQSFVMGSHEFNRFVRGSSCMS